MASFIGDWKAPKGPLALGLKPEKTAGLADLDKVMMPDALSTMLRLHRHLSRHQGGCRQGRREETKTKGGTMKRRTLLAASLLLPAVAGSGGGRLSVAGRSR